MSAATVTAIVVSYHTGPRLKECLYALSADPQVHKAVIVDNGNPVEARQFLDDFCRKHDGFNLVSGHGNIGFGAGVNLGASKTDSEHLLIINPDAVLRWDSIEPLQETAQNLTEPWIIGGRIYDIRGREERGPRRKELTLFRAMTRVIGWNTWTLEDRPAPTEPVAMPVISGAFFIMSKAGFDQLDGFDEGYFLHVEDIDLCRRCREAGGVVMYDPRAGALHYGATSDAPSKTVAKYKADSLTLYFRKFAQGPFHRLMVELLVPFIGLATRLRRS